MVSGPLCPGMRRSISVMSGWWAANAAIAATPSPASATTSRSGSASIIVRSPIRTTGWSSTMRMRIFLVAAGSGIGVLRLVLSRWNGHLDAGAVPGLALDGQLAQLGPPLAHAQQAEVAGLGALGGGRIEPPPVVADDQ